MKKVLVTGSNGLLGQKITTAVLSKNNIDLIATSTGANRHPVKEGYVYEELDITDAKQIEAVFSKYKPHAVINTAAMTNVDACEKEQEKCRLLNVEAVKNLVKASEKHKIHLVHLSTDFIFDGKNGPYTEEANPNPLSFYGQSKWDAEKIIASSSADWCILRTIIVYGVVNDMSRSNIVLWAKGALEKGEQINVVNDQWRMPTLAEDLAELCLSAVEKSAEGVFNASGKDMMSMVELVEKVADFWKLDKSLIKPITTASLNQAAKRPAKTGFILDKTFTELNYRPHTFEEGLAILNQQLTK